MPETEIITIRLDDIIHLLREEQRGTTYPSKKALRLVLEGKNILYGELEKKYGLLMNAYIITLILIHTSCLFLGVDVFSLTREEYGIMYVLLISMIMTAWLMLLWSMLVLSRVNKNYWLYHSTVNFIKFYQFLQEGYVDKDVYAEEALRIEHLSEEEKQKFIEAFQAYLPKE